MVAEYDDEAAESGGLLTLESISPKAARLMVDWAINRAHQLGLRKFAVGVMGVERFLLAYSTVGGVTPNNELAVRNKLETVMFTRRSIHDQIRHMKKEGVDPSNYGEAIKTLFIGGLAVFSDADKTRLVGAIAGSGGNALEDCDCVEFGVQHLGLFTDHYVEF
jgi:hypothetical protein